MQKTLLELIDHVQESVDVAEIDVLNSMCSVYTKSVMILEQCDETVQESFKDDLNGPVLGTKDESMVKRILMLIPRLIAKIMNGLKRLTASFKLHKKEREKMNKDLDEAINSFSTDPSVGLKDDTNSEISKNMKVSEGYEFELYFDRGGYPLNGYLSDITNARSMLGEDIGEGRPGIASYKQYDDPVKGIITICNENQRGSVAFINFMKKAMEKIEYTNSHLKSVKFKTISELSEYRSSRKHYLNSIYDQIEIIKALINEYTEYFKNEVTKYVDKLTGDIKIEYATKMQSGLANLVTASLLVNDIEKQIYEQEKHDTPLITASLRGNGVRPNNYAKNRTVEGKDLDENYGFDFSQNVNKQ